MIVKCDQGDFEFSIPEKYSKVGIKLSGGADSAILCYLLAKYKVTERPDLEIVITTGVIRTRPFQYEKASSVRDKIAELLDVPVWQLFKKHHTYNMETRTLRLRQHEETNRLYETGQVDCHIWGVTQNPPSDVMETLLPGRDTTRDPTVGETKVWRDTSYNPFTNIDKRGVASVYRLQGVLDDIFPLTRSCEIDNTYVFTDATTCQTANCFWCQERKWGFQL